MSRKAAGGILNGLSAKAAKASSQFHHPFTSNFCSNILLAKKIQRQTVIREICAKKLLYEKAACKIYTRGLYHEHLGAALLHADSKSEKRH